MRKDRSTDIDRTSEFINNNAGTIAIIPAYLLCFVTLLVLVLDMLMPSMAEKQYIIYPISVRMVSLVGIICMAACLGSELEKGRLRIGLEDIFFILFAVWMMISTVINGITHDAVFSVAYRYVGVYDLIIFVFIYRFCAAHVYSPKHKQIFYASFILIADTIAAAFIYNQITDRIAAFNGKLEPSAVFFHGNHYGYYLVMVIAVAAGCLILLDGKMEILGAVSLAVNLGALALNRSMGSFIAVGAVFLIIIIASIIRGGSERKKALISAVTIIFLAAAALILLKPLREDLIETGGEFMQIISGDNNIYAGNGRWGIWQYVIDYIKDAPVWGYGCEGIAAIMKDYTLTTSPHNEPLTYAAFFGIPAAVLYCLAVLTSVIKGFKNGKEWPEKQIAAFASTAYFCSSLFGVAFFYTAPFMFIFLGMSSEKECQSI